jgi:antitoxin (DNA-binding transcriptional repressor) of toxin-antitoxin stability system
MNTVTLQAAQQHLPELVQKLAREGGWLITDADQPVARLSWATPQPSLRRLEPQSVGAVLRPCPSSADDTWGEMLDPGA